MVLLRTFGGLRVHLHIELTGGDLAVFDCAEEPCAVETLLECRRRSQQRGGLPNWLNQADEDPLTLPPPLAHLKRVADDSPASLAKYAQQVLGKRFQVGLGL
jgi:hypothetical protein